MSLARALAHPVVAGSLLLLMVLLSLPAVRTLDLQVDIAALYADRAGAERPSAPLVIAFERSLEDPVLQAVSRSVASVDGVRSVHPIDPAHILREVVPEGVLEQAGREGWRLRGLRDRAGLVVQAEVGRERSLVPDIQRAVDREIGEGVGEAHLLGLPVVEKALAAQSRRDLPWLLAVAVLVLALGLALVGRTWRAVVLPLGAVGLATAATMGVAGLLELPLGGPNLLVPVVVLVFGLADSVYVVHAHVEGRPLHQTLRQVGLPCALTTGTTVLSLVLLIPLTSPPLGRFAGLAAVGIALALVASLALPALVLRVFPGPTLRRAGGVSLPTWVEGARRSRWALLALGATIAVPGLVLLPQLRPSLRLLDELPAQDPTRMRHERLTRELGGLAPLEVQVSSASGLGDPDLYAALLDQHAHLVQQREVGGVLSFAEVALWLGRAEGRSPRLLLRERRTLGNSRALRLGHAALRREDPSSRFWALDDGTGYRLHARMLDWDPDAWLRVVDAVEGQRERPGIRTRTEGFVAVAARGARRIPRDLWTSCLATCLGLLTVLSIGLRSLRTALLGLLPALFATGLTAGALWLFDIGLTEAIVLAFALALGVGVDVWIHLALRARSLARQGRPEAEARRAALSELLLPVTWTTGLLVAGLAVLLTSGLATPRDVALVVMPAFIVDVLATVAVFAMAGTGRSGAASESARNAS